jgi:hypothetical protein
MIRKRNNMETAERHAGTVMQALVIGLLAWTGLSLVTIQKDVAILQTEIMALKTTMIQGTNDRYRSMDAAKDFAIVHRELDNRDRAHKELTGRVEELEKSIYRNRKNGYN